MQAGGGGNGLSRTGGGLARYRSAPATWLEALLEDEETDVVQPLNLASSTTTTTTKPPLHPPAAVGTTSTEEASSTAASGRYAADLGLLDSVGSGAGGLSGLLRQNSSPAEFLSDGYFGIPAANYDYLMDVNSSESPSKRLRESDSNSAKASYSPSIVKGEQGGGISGFLDAEMDNLSEDAVLCRVRAKRGCATHPRSIAERVRRTRISDRIRKLQELVPNMDKQTNTADMLEEAVEYVKFLQKQIQDLTEQQQKCKCITKE